MEDWEPILEKWDCALKINPLHVTPDETIVSVDSSSTFSSLSDLPPPPPKVTQSDQKEQTGMSILFCSPSILNLNFSKQMLSTLLRTVKTWTAEIEEDEAIQNTRPRKKRSEHSYYIRNLTGFNVYWAAFKEEELGRDPNIMVLPDNTKQPLGSSFKRRGRRIGAAAEYRKNVMENYFISMEVEYVSPPIPVTTGTQ